MKILVCDPISKKGIEILKSIPRADVIEKSGLSEKELAALVGDVEVLLVRSGVKITDQVLNSAKKLKVVGRAGMGYDNIDVEEATRLGIVVMNTPGSNSVTTAEHTMALLMACARNVPQAYSSLKGGKWDRKGFVGVEIAGKTLGVIGLGNVGREVLKRARGFQMQVVGYDPFISEKAAKEMGVELCALDDLYRRSDFITLHTVLNETTHHMIGKKAFAKMKPRVRIINCARGGLIDEEALLEALNSEKVASAALDVFEQEPPPKDSPLLSHPNVVVTPHLGASTDEAQEQVALAIAEQIKAYLVDDMVINGVNVPSVSREVLAAIGPYIDLAEKLGKFLGQLGMEKMDEVRVECAGEVLKYDLSPITAGVLCGLIETSASDQSVNFVNAHLLARERGIRVTESKTQETTNFLSLVTVEIRSSQESHVVCGTVFGQKYARVVRFDDFDLEFTPRGHAILIHNEDKPGVVGAWGTILGKHKINISQMQVALDSKNKQALSVVNIDSPAPVKVLDELRKVTNIRQVRQMVL